MTVGRVGGRDDAGGQRQARPGLRVDRRQDGCGPGAGRARRLTGRRCTPRWRRQRVPPAAIARLAQHSRHGQLTDQGDRPQRALLRGRLVVTERDPGVGQVDERLRHRRLAVASRLGRPALTPTARGGSRHVAVRAGQPDQAPRPWHDPVRVVAAPAGGQPPTARMSMRHGVHEPGRLAHGRGGHAQVRKRVPGV